MKQKELIQIVAAQVLKMLSDMLASVILIGKSLIIYIRGDSMIWDFVGRRPLSVRDYVVSIKGGPKL